MNINITPQELDGMIQRLRQWSSQLATIRSSMHSYSQHLRQTWRDAQYEPYISNIESISKGLDQDSQGMEHQAKTLLVLKQNLERTVQEYQSMMSQRPR
jgi:uncharacterized protein YukE